MKGKYNAVELAKEVISIANKKSIGRISNLQIQKVLYYIQGAFIKEYNRKAFDETIECWPYGPVVRNVWKEYSVFGRQPIRLEEYQGILNNDEEKLVVEVLKDKLGMNVWDLVEQTHEETPWCNAEKEGRDLSDEDMINFFS